MTKPIIRMVESYITLTSEELAACFWSMDADQQASFFNWLGAFARDRFPMQLEYITQSQELNGIGKNTMWQIGCYGGIK